MDPVTRALQTIAAIERETRERIHAEAAPTYPTETVLSRVLSTSSKPSSDGRNGPTAPSTHGEATADLASSIDQVETTAPEAAFALTREIRIDKRDRVLVAPARDITRHAITIIAGVLFLALALCLGWIGGLNSDFFTPKPASPPVKKVDADPDPAKSNRRHQATDPLRTKHAAKAPQPTGERNTKPAPVPETRPTTIEGWTIRQINGGTAVLEGPNGVWKARRGDTIPGVGKIDSIVLWGNRWIVATSRGLISTP